MRARKTHQCLHGTTLKAPEASSPSRDTQHSAYAAPLEAPASLVSPALPSSTHRRYLATLHQPDPGRPSASIARRQPLLSAATRPHPLYPSRHADPLQDSSTTHTLNLNAPSGFNGHQQAGASARLEDTGGHTSGPIRHHLKAPASLVSPALPGSTHRRYLATLHQPDPGRSSAPCARHHLPCYAGDRFPVWLPPRQPHTLPTMQQTAPVRHLTPVCECGGRK